MRTCPVCGVEIANGPVSKRYCGAVCRQAAWWSRRMGKGSAEAVAGVNGPATAIQQAVTGHDEVVVGVAIRNLKTGRMRTVRSWAQV